MDQRDKDETKGEIVKPKTLGLGFRIFIFIYFLNRQTLVPAEILNSKLAEMTQNRPKSDLRWNMRYSRLYLFAILVWDIPAILARTT